MENEGRIKIPLLLETHRQSGVKHTPIQKPVSPYRWLKTKAEGIGALGPPQWLYSCTCFKGTKGSWGHASLQYIPSNHTQDSSGSPERLHSPERTVGTLTELGLSLGRVSDARCPWRGHSLSSFPAAGRGAALSLRPGQTTLGMVDLMRRWTRWGWRRKKG